MPSHQIQSPVWSLRKGCWTLAPFSNPGYASDGADAGGGREDDEDAWSGWGGGNDGREDDEDAWSGFAGWVGGAAGVERLLLSWLGWGRVRPFSVSLAWVGPEVVGPGGAWGRKKGCVACWLGSLSGRSAGVCMVAFAWLPLRSASLRTVSGGSVGHCSAAGLLLKGWWRW